METALTILAAFVAGAGGKAIIDWLRFKKTDTASVHRTETDALLISTGMVKTWLYNASEAQVLIAQLRVQLADQSISARQAATKCEDVERELQKCKESLDECRKQGGCA